MIANFLYPVPQMITVIQTVTKISSYVSLSLMCLRGSEQFWRPSYWGKGPIEPPLQEVLGKTLNVLWSPNRETADNLFSDLLTIMESE